jgi:histidyl-tRNA synthetase
MQFDADTVGSASPAADAEMCMMAADTMDKLGFKRGDYVVKVNNRKVLDGIMDAIGIGGEHNAIKRLTVLRAIDKHDRLGADGVRSLLGPGRKDESGDFTKGAALPQDAIGQVMYMFAPPPGGQSGTSNIDVINRARNRFPSNAMYQEGLDELQKIAEFTASANYGIEQIRIDPSVVRGLEYYTGPVFEVELTFSTDSTSGSPRFGSVGGGGRYDGLVSRFRGEPVPATGFSIGVSRLLAALQHLGKVETKAEAGPVVVTVFDKDHIADYQQMVASLRNAGIRAELYLGSGKFGPQMKYADKRNSPCVVIQGSDEKAKGEVTIKDLIVGAELAKLEKGREEHLQKQAEAQRAVPEAQLVEAVRAVLARHKLGPR